MYRKEKGENCVGKRAGPSTPSTAWPHFELSSSISARKLCASLWELQPHYPLHNMLKGSPSLFLQHFKDNHGDVHHPLPRTPLHQPRSSSSLTRHIAALQHHGLVERNYYGFQNPASPSSYTSSLEVAPYNPAIRPSSSLGFKEMNGGLGYRVKPSTVLLKVLNRICALEEQHISNMSLVKALKTELDLSRVRIKDLQGQDSIKFAIRSLRVELEDERKLRKHSESLQLKLAQQLSEVNSCFANTLKELERERKVRILLENLCDEFARGVQCIKHNHHGIYQDNGEKNHERLILRISKAWLDERMQIKELIKENASCRHSLESFPLHEAVSSPQGAANEEDSGVRSDKQCNELNRTAKMRPRNSSKRCKLRRSRGQFDEQVHNESSFRLNSRVIQSICKGRASSPVQQWISKLKSPDFENSDPFMKLRNESIAGKISRSKTRRAAVV